MSREKYDARRLARCRARYKPVYCRICGKQMIRNFDIPGGNRDRMHTECILKQCAEIYSKNGKLDRMNIQRLYARGYDIPMLREFIETGEVF